MTLLNNKSEEIEVLARKLNEERVKYEGATNRIAILEQQVQVAQEAAQREGQRADVFLQQSQVGEAKLSEDNSNLQAHTDALKARVTCLEEELARERSKYKVTEEHFERIRVLYGEETGRSSVLRDAKKSLNKELDIAQKQTSEGVQAVRAMLEKRLKDMEDDRNRWRKAAEFIMEKDTRTNDEIRKRAAEEPELRAKFHQVKLKYATLRNTMEEKEEKYEEQEQELQELQEMREEVARLRQQLAEGRVDSTSPTPVSMANGRSLLELHSQSSDHGSRSSEEGHLELQTQAPAAESYDDDDLVYRCQWRLEDDKFCNAVFPTTSVSYLRIYAE